jgi:hypothetical protein
VIDELSGHCGLPSLQISGKFGADVTMLAAKGKRSTPLANRLRENRTLRYKWALWTGLQAGGRYLTPSQITSIFRHSPQRFGNYRDDFIAG